MDLTFLTLALAARGLSQFSHSENGTVPFADAPDRAVEWGRQGLVRSESFPWYDLQTDGLRRIELREPTVSEPSGKREWGGFDSLLQGLAWTLLAAILAAFVYILMRQWLRSRRAAASAPDAASAAVAPQFELLPAAVAPGRGGLLEEARRARAAGDFGRAVLYLFSYQLLRLDQRQIIRLARGKTNRQYLREARARPDLPGILQPTMVAFEDVFFGRQPLPQDRFEACWAELPRFEQLCAEGSA